jgi:hypothetical protein
MGVERNGVQHADPGRSEAKAPYPARVRRPAEWNKSSQRYSSDMGVGSPPTHTRTYCLIARLIRLPQRRCVA